MKGLKLRLIILVILFLAAAFSVYALIREGRQILTVAFLDVGQGDAIFIEAPSGNQLLIDGGPDKSVLRELSRVMPFYDRSIDVVMMTHPDSDHVSGLNDVLDKYQVSLFLEPGVTASSSVYRELESRIMDYESNGKIKKILARRGMAVDLGRGVYLEILFPDRDPAGWDTNNASIVTRLVYGENEFLLTGDSPQSIENYLISLGGLESDVLKAGHHGSKTSSSEFFVAAVSPEYAVISVGANNRYGHPNQEVLDILNKFEVKILRTDERGKIMFKSDGTNLEVK